MLKSYKEYLTESFNVPLVVVDVQPFYHKYCKHIVKNVVDLINKHKRVKIFYNGEDLGFESKEEIIEYYLENGLDYEEIFKLNFTEKNYGFFRSWMDNNYPISMIITVIREMVMQREYDSRDLNLKELLKDYNLDESDFIFFEGDPINIPDINIAEMKSKFNNCYIVGGGRNECLKEVEILFNAFNIHYRIIKELTY